MKIRMIALGALLAPALAAAYPLDGYEETGIRRVEGSRLANEGVIRDVKQPPGALLGTGQVDLRLLDRREMDLPAPDPEFSRQIKALLGGEANRYGIAVLDLSDLDHPRYGVWQESLRQNVGSVGKLVVGLGLFQALADTWPDDEQKRIEVLRDTMVIADRFSHWDHHTMRIFDPATNKLVRRPMKDGDRASQWEYLDWMLSVSANSAAAMNQRQGMLIRRYGKDFQPSEEEIHRFFRETPAGELTDLYQRTFWDPIPRNGLDIENLRQGSLFTREGKQQVKGGGNSYGTARELMKYLLKMEQGKLVDEFSSRQLKRLLYMTERRIRYASSPALKDAAVYFKSGSLYKCSSKCKPYHGDVRNFMNSVAIVESPAAERRLYYMVVIISNVLRKNSAVAHQSLGTRIQRLIEKAHPPPATGARKSEPAAKTE